ncbi:putative acyl-activating enzyme 1, peroxisomal [Hordeum vulgare]|nr:putative acyl-activating enzyme 1, peroxisomal [Hordeum vulgare]
MPCAFVTLKDGASTTEADMIEFCRARLPRYMAPRTVLFVELPKTSTGKTQKYLLHEKARAMGNLTKLSRSKL